MKIFIVVPAYNEQKKIVDTVEKILENSKRKVIVVDDGSIDATKELLTNKFKRNRRIRLIFHKCNKGKGVAMRTGARAAWKMGGEAIIYIDADGQHNPKLLDKFECALEEGRDVVVGVRVMKADMSPIRRMGNYMIGFLVWILFGAKIEDMLCGYRAMTKKAYKKIKWNTNRYGVETEMLCNIWRERIDFFKVVVETIYLPRKKNQFNIVDGVKIMLQLPYWRFRKSH